jgi:signal peptidase
MATLEEALSATPERRACPGRVLKIARSAASAALLAVLVLAVATMAFIGLGPLTGRYRVLTVLSGSMRPVAPTGSVVVDTPIPLARVRVGDVITYHIPVGDRHVVTHRVIQIRQGGAEPVVVTKGDANSAADPWVATLHGATAWKMRTAIPGVGSFIRWLRSPQVHRVATLVVPLLLAAVWISVIWRPEVGPARVDRHRRRMQGS